MKKSKDNLGDRMKAFYEDRAKTFLPRRTYTIIRIDGKAFHTYTKGLTRPFDWDLVNDMDETAKFLCENIQGAKCAFVQSDEISIVLTDFDKITTDAWYDGNVQKITSISASLATAKFNELRPGKLAFFDSRCYTIPSESEVINYFIWRQQDTVRNSISSAAQSEYSPKQLHGVNSGMMQEMLFTEKGINWNDYDPKLKRGRMIRKKEFVMKGTTPNNGAIRSKWIVEAPPTFTEEIGNRYMKNRLSIKPMMKMKDESKEIETWDE
jgi:tRNA(His) 5'-end guanylyltransferase